LFSSIDLNSFTDDDETDGCRRGYDRERLLWLAGRFNARWGIVSGRFNAGYSYFTALRQDYSA
jgi:hypothetical protein